MFSGKAHIQPDTQAVFFCFGIPGKDNTITDAALDAEAWTLAAGADRPQAQRCTTTGN